MALSITKQLQNDTKALFRDLNEVLDDSQDIYDAYWKTDANVKIAAVALDTDPVTVGTKFNKTQYLSGVSLVEQITKFFGNVAVAQADYNGTCQNLKYGNTAALTPLSVATEDLGTRMCVLAMNLLGYQDRAKHILESYHDNSVSSCMASWSSDQVVFGSDMTKQQLDDAMILFTEFQDFMGNAAVTTGDYMSTLSKWKSVP